MAIMPVSSAVAFEAKIAYCRTVLAGRFVPVPVPVPVPCTVAAPDVPDDFVVQSKSAPRDKERALSTTGVIRANLNQMKYVLLKSYDLDVCWPILKEAFGDSPSSSAMISEARVNPDYKIEIELTALVAGA